MEGARTNTGEPRLNLDTNAQRNFIKFMIKLGEKTNTTVRFFDRTDCYTVHGTDDCDRISKIVYKSNAYIRQMLPNEQIALSYVAISKNNFELAVRELLLVRNFRVEVYVRESSESDWKLEYRGSPGNLLQFEDILFSNKEILVGNSILSLHMRLDGTQRKLGLAAVQQNDCLIQVLEFVDDDFYTELEAAIVLLGPKECLLPTVDNDYAAIKILLERNGVMVTVVKKSSANTHKSDLTQDLNKLLRFAKGQQEDVSTFPEMELKIAMEALHAAVIYLDLPNDAANLGHFEMKQLLLNRFVHLDSAALSALNILPKPGTQVNSSVYRCQSILGVLDLCCTPQGHRLMAQWVKQPLRSREVLNDRHNIVECLLEAETVLKSLYDDYMKRIPDILMLTKKLMRKRATLQDLFRIYQVLLRSPKIINALLSLENATVTSVLCAQFQSCLKDLSGLKQMVESVMDFSSLDSGEYLVKASFDAQLEGMKDNMDRLLSKMERLQTKASEDLNMERGQTVRLVNIGHLGFHFRITLKDDSILRKNKNYKVLDVVKSGVRFTTDKLTEYSEEYNNIRKQYEDQQKSIVEEIIQIAIGYAAPLTLLNSELAQLDCLISFAMAAQSAPIPYVRPKMLEEGSGILVLKDVRHPCLELQEGVTFISNSIEFNKDICNMFIITGPNMGGKSTYIRSIGTAVLMAQIGAFVPCSEATISMVDSILGRVGASDNIIKGLSTFMVEMIEMSGIIRTATEKSLVIIDELGRGTSTYEGCGIAWSIAEHLAKETKCFTLFATHFHEITDLAKTVKTVQNCHVAAVADQDTFTLLHQVRPGPMEKSFGIQIARLADFPDAVVNNAEEVYGQFEDIHVEKKTKEEKAVLDEINSALEEFSNVGNDANINESDLTKLVEQFTRDIKELVNKAGLVGGKD
ncbi:DNA mismatch repair protein spellchecker 1 [Teleopsis dalmanni]|uniref:DNA mismatch repair protein spellchecker 1 n=1 Tax=Teleopsis dalmanni TaxID=139649 RepID=UPI0018CEC68F|nr:DNA mismatch repair protein spellchecker 1 [Teleopsis dalmanni]